MGSTIEFIVLLHTLTFYKYDITFRHLLHSEKKMTARLAHIETDSLSSLQHVLCT